MRTTTFSKAIAILWIVLLFISGAVILSIAQCPVPGMPSVITGSGYACPGQSKTYSINAVSGATSYTWTLPSGATINGSNPYTGTSTSVLIDFGPSYFPPGTILVKANNACGSGPNRSKTVNAYYPGLPSSISGSSTACAGDVVTYSINPMTDVISYSWTVGSNMAIQSGQGTTSISVLFLGGFNGNETVAVAGNYGCGTGSQRTKTIQKGNPPQAPAMVDGPENACPGSTESYSVDPVPGYTYTWTVPAGATLTGQGTPNVTVTFPPGFISGKVQCKYNNGCGSSPNSSLNVYGRVVRPGMINGFASGICNGTTNYSITPVSGATSYQWTVPAGATINSGQGTTSISVTFPASVSGNVSVSSVNDCGVSYPRSLAVTGDVIITEQPVTKSVCEDATTDLTVNVPGVNLSFQWYQDGMALTDDSKRNGTQTNTLNFISVDSLHEGNYYVEVTSTCAASVTSDQAAFSVNMRPPVPSDITYPFYGCPGNTGVQLSVLPGGYNTDYYQWIIGPDINLISGQNTHEITVDLLPTTLSGYTVTVVGVNSCGTSKDTSKAWMRYMVSVPQILSGPNLVCQGQNTVLYTASNVGQTSYNWTYGNGIIYRSGQGTDQLEVDFDQSFTEGQICVNASSPCFTSAYRCKTVKFDVPATPGNIVGPSLNLCNTVASFSVPSVNGANSYTWSVPAGASIIGLSNGNNVNVSFSGPIQGNICVAGVGNCTTGSSRCMLLRSQQAPGSITCSSPVLCAGQTGVTFTCPSVPNTNSYQWTVPSGSVIVSGQGTTSITVNLGSNNGKVGVKAFNDCGQSGTTTYSVNLSCRLQEHQAETEDSNLDIYPNPARDKFFISLAIEKDEVVEVSITDLLGKTLRKELIPVRAGVNKMVFEKESLITGIYFVTVKASDKIYQRRLVIEQK
jgi:hypothetical protein